MLARGKKTSTMKAGRVTKGPEGIGEARGRVRRKGKEVMQVAHDSNAGHRAVCGSELYSDVSASENESQCQTEAGWGLRYDATSGLRPNWPVC